MARKPSRRPGRYCIRPSRVLTSAVSWPMSCLTRLASDRFRFDQTGWPDRDTDDSMMPIVASESDLQALQVLTAEDALAALPRHDADHSGQHQW